MSDKVAQKNRPRLGRGLSSLIPTLTPPAEPVMVEVGSDPSSAAAAELPAPAPVPVAVVSADPDGSPLEIAIEAIQPNPHQPRRSFDDARLAELAASLRTTGVIQPILVRRQGAHYELIAGERRWRAAKIAGLRRIPAIVRDVDSFTQAQIALIENIQREDLNPIDRAQGYRALIDQLGLTQAELAGRLGEDRSSIANFLRLLELGEPVRELLRTGRLSVGHAKLLAGVSDILEQQRLAELVVAQDLSVRNLERLLQNPQAGTAPASSRPLPSAHIQDLEKNLTRQLGMRVQVKASARGKGRGRLVIHYASLDQFDELLGRLGVATEQ
jgi:ParB family chromosome partitioning protein